MENEKLGEVINGEFEKGNICLGCLHSQWMVSQSTAAVDPRSGHSIIGAPTMIIVAVGCRRANLMLPTTQESQFQVSPVTMKACSGWESNPDGYAKLQVVQLQSTEKRIM